eukprot:258763-Chlamydomonas_euryale.AAC.3
MHVPLPPNHSIPDPYLRPRRRRRLPARPCRRDIPPCAGSQRCAIGAARRRADVCSFRVI